MYDEAIYEYTKLINEYIEYTPYIRINLGNIYYKLKKFSMAIKMYKMAIDLNSSKNLKYKYLKKLAHSYVKWGDYQEAIIHYMEIINHSNNFEIAFNLILCLYITGDKIKMKEIFKKILSFENIWDDKNNTKNIEEIKYDNYYNECLKQKREEQKYIIEAAKLISPVIEDTILKGYDWVVEILKETKYQEVLSELEICKALEYIKDHKINKAIKLLKSFEKKDTIMMARAAVNLSFLYFLEGDFNQSNKYCDIALGYDKFNSGALVNKGNCYFVKNDFAKAREKYLKAISINVDCIEAFYNLSYVNKKINNYDDALISWEKLKFITEDSPEVIYQIASIYELKGQNKQALEWYNILLTIIPNEPYIHRKIGDLYSFKNDDKQAFLHYLESYKLWPSNIDTISWLGIHHVRNLEYKKSIQFFDIAALVQPKDLKWKLMVASCWRRLENFEKSLKIYLEIYKKDPENLESLRFIVQISQELGISYEIFNKELKILEWKMEIEEGERVQNIDLNVNNNDHEENNHIGNIPKVYKNNQNKKINSGNNDDSWGDNEGYDIMIGMS